MNEINTSDIIGFIYWTIIFSSVGFAFFGVIFKKIRLLTIAIILSIPLSLYSITGYSWFLFVGGPIPLFLFCSRFAIKRGITWLSWIMLAPLAVVSVSLAFSVFFSK